MKSKEEILAATTERTLCIIPDSPLHKAVVEAMQIYADQETAKLKKEITSMRLQHQKDIDGFKREVKTLKSELFKEKSKEKINFGE